MNHPQDPKDDGTRVPGFTYAWMIPYFTRIARRHGYAIAVHGSMSRDLDLIAVPWVENANDPMEMLEEVCRITGGTLIAPHNQPAETIRPHGRKAYNIIWPGAWHFVDISIMPRDGDRS